MLMSAEDVWQLKIPIRLSLAQDEISSPGDVKPVYVLAPRFAYLPALAQQCLSFFQQVLLHLPGQAATSTPWFEYEGLALSWTQPLGVLHDLLTQTQTQPAGGEPLEQQQQPVAAGFSTSAIPWCLTVHYRSQPATLSNSWQNSGTAKDHFLSSLKEAGYCCRGTDGCNAVMRLPGPVQDDLWAGVNRGDSAAVRQHLTPLRLSPTQRQGSSIPTVPVRLYIRQHSAGAAAGETFRLRGVAELLHTMASLTAAGLMGVWSDVYGTSRAVEVQQADGSSTLLAHLAHSVMPQRFPAPQQQATPAAAGPTPLAGRGSSSIQQLRPAQLQSPGDDAVQQADEHEQQPQCAQGGSEASAGLTQPLQEPHAAADSDPLGALGTTGQPVAAAVANTPQEPSSPATGQQQDSKASSSPGQPALGQGSAAGGTAGCVALPPTWPPQCAVFVCGIQPDWCTPLAWLHANLKAADGFLYVVVHIQA